MPGGRDIEHNGFPDILRTDRNMITKNTAMSIALAYREIETAEELLKQVEDTIRSGDVPDIRDAFGRHQNGLQLGVPSGSNAQRLFNVPWTMVRPVIETHLAQQRAIIATLSEKARIELGAEAAAV